MLDANQAGNTGFYAAPQVQQNFAVTGLTITGDQFSSGSSTSPRMTLSGTAAAGTSAVTVKICTVATTPCPGADLVSTVVTGASPTNPWTTAASAAGALALQHHLLRVGHTGRCPDQCRLYLRHTDTDFTDSRRPDE